MCLRMRVKNLVLFSSKEALKNFFPGTYYSRFVICRCCLIQHRSLALHYMLRSGSWAAGMDCGAAIFNILSYMYHIISVLPLPLELPLWFDCLAGKTSKTVRNCIVLFPLTMRIMLVTLYYIHIRGI